jgi:hypothetical protein
MEGTRTSLLRKSAEPGIEPQLPPRCLALHNQGTSPERVRVESNHRARLRRASLLSPELRTLECSAVAEPDPRETGRARTGTYLGHNRALCPVELRPPRLPVKGSTAAPAGFEPAAPGVSERRLDRTELRSYVSPSHLTSAQAWRAGRESNSQRED